MSEIKTLPPGRSGCETTGELYPQIVSKAERRKFSAECKLRILAVNPQRHVWTYLVSRREVQQRARA